MPFPFKSIFHLKNQGTVQVIHNKSIKQQSEHSIHTNSKQSEAGTDVSSLYVGNLTSLLLVKI